MQHLHRTTSTSIRQTTMTQTAKLPHQQDCLAASQQLLLQFWEIVGVLEKGSDHALAPDSQFLPISDVATAPDKQCKSINDDRWPYQSVWGGRGVPGEAVQGEKGLTRMRAWERHSRAFGMRRRSP